MLVVSLTDLLKVLVERVLVHSDGGIVDKRKNNLTFGSLLEVSYYSLKELWWHSHIP